MPERAWGLVRLSVDDGTESDSALYLSVDDRLTLRELLHGQVQPPDRRQVVTQLLPGQVGVLSSQRARRIRHVELDGLQLECPGAPGEGRAKSARRRHLEPDETLYGQGVGIQCGTTRGCHWKRHEMSADGATKMSVIGTG